MKADMSGARTTPKLLELQAECLARDLDAAGASSSDESSDEEFDADALSQPAYLAAPAGPAALQEGLNNIGEAHSQQNDMTIQHDHDAESHSSDSEDGSSQSDRDELQPGQDVRADRKAHKKAVKEANRERRKHKMPKHVKKKKIKSHKK